MFDRPIFSGLKRRTVFIRCAPPEQCKKPAKAMVTSAVHRMSFQTHMAQNFSFFVFGG